MTQRLAVIATCLLAFAALAAAPKTEEVSGTLSQIDAAKETFSLKTAAGVEQFKLAEAAETLIDGAFKGLQSFKDGDSVKVTFYVLADHKLATRVEKGKKKGAK